MLKNDENFIKEDIESYHSLDVDKVFNKLNSQPEGLTNEEATKRLQKFGKNQLEEIKKKTKLKLLIEQFNDPIVYVLLAAALISLLVDKLVNFIVILVVIVLNGMIGFIQEAKAEAALNSLKAMASPEADILRDCTDSTKCTEIRIKTYEIVPGDVLLLEAGDRVPADARLFDIKNLEVDEAILTGESLTVRKNMEIVDENSSIGDRKNMVYSGTFVTYGRGRAVVTATGMKTETGKIAQLLNETEVSEPPIEKRISDLSKKLGLLAFIASILTFIIGSLKGFLLVEMLLFAIATLVSSIPSGLPAVITITLAIGVGRMAKRNAIIRKLSSIDALGSITAIVTDKTGTLTTNQMTVRKIVTNDFEIDISGVGYTPEGQFFIEENKIEIDEYLVVKQLLKNATLVNDARLRKHEINPNSFQWEIVGDPTEGSLIVMAQKAGINREILHNEYPRLDEIPFDPKYRYMATIHRKSDDRLLISFKGAQESVLNLSTKILTKNGSNDLNQNQKEELILKSNELASQGLRVLGIATHEIERDTRNITPEELEHLKSEIMSGNIKLTFLGMVGMIDPPREEVKDSIKLAQSAGIRVRMATGDHKLTAEAIGKELGIIVGDDRVVTGLELDELTDEELDENIQYISAFARVSPSHKHRIVNSLRKQNEIVGMTGDGANDAPAIKAAHVGIAMGITGTDVTKETASMILTDDNFASIINAIEEGRVVFANIKKGVKFLITTNIGEVFTILLALILLPTHALIFTPLMILWVNLVTDGSLTVALAMEGKESDVMKQPPRKQDEKILDKSLFNAILSTAIVMATGVLIIFTFYWDQQDTIKGQTLAFTTLALFQIINAINSRSPTQSIFKLGFTSNRALFGGLIISFSLQIVAVSVPFFNQILATAPLSILDWFVIILMSMSSFAIEELRKFLQNRQ